MGKFDGYLICTDYDGTFAIKGEAVAENLPAVEYFIENGGHFTVATGRTAEFIRNKPVCGLINAPACVYNGSAVYDFSQDKILKSSYLALTVGEILDQLGPQLPTPELLHIYREDEMLDCADLCQIPDTELNRKPLKLLFRYKTVEDADACKALALQRLDPGLFYISKSWSLGLEINPIDGTKGRSLAFIKNYIPGIHTAIGVGDNENDRELLAWADIGAAPENAVAAVKEIAQLHLVSCAEGAVADLVRRLEEKL